MKAFRQTRQAPARLGGLPGSVFVVVVEVVVTGSTTAGFSSIGGMASARSGMRDGLGVIFVTEIEKRP